MLGVIASHGGVSVPDNATVVDSRSITGASPHTATPAGVASGDLLVWATSTRNSAPNTLGPEGGGWTQAYSLDTKDDEICALWYKVAGGSEPSSYTWTHAAGTTAASVFVAFRGLTGTLASSQVTATTRTSPSVTGAVDGIVLNLWHNNYQTATKSSLPSGAPLTFVNEAHMSGEVNTLVAFADTDSTSPTATVTANGGGSTYYAAAAAVFS